MKGWDLLLAAALGIWVAIGLYGVLSVLAP